MKNTAGGDLGHSTGSAPSGPPWEPHPSGAMLWVGGAVIFRSFAAVAAKAAATTGETMASSILNP